MKKRRATHRTEGLRRTRQVISFPIGQNLRMRLTRLGPLLIVLETHAADLSHAERLSPDLARKKLARIMDRLDREHGKMRKTLLAAYDWVGQP